MTRPGHRGAASAAVSRRRRRTLITGAASGIGRAIAERCAARGAELVLVDVNAPALETTAAALTAAGARVRTYVLDVTDTSRIVGFREHVHRDAGPLDVLVNNAGMVFGGAFLDLPLEQHLTTYRVNTLGLVAMTHAFLPDLLAGRDGHVVKVASASTLIGLPFGPTYASSKWAVLGFAESLVDALTGATSGSRASSTVHTAAPARDAGGPAGSPDEHGR